MNQAAAKCRVDVKLTRGDETLTTLHVRGVRVYARDNEVISFNNAFKKLSGEKRRELVVNAMNERQRQELTKHVNSEGAGVVIRFSGVETVLSN